jgi:lipid II:glycine glycyltransferase (peptidoglycan interpeptide bridge formation enzyme)
VLLEENGKAVGAGYIGLHRLPLLGSLAYCAKGPWLDWENAAHVEAFFIGVRALLRRHRVFALQVEPEALETDERLKEQFQALGLRRYWTNHQFKTTMVVDLAPDDAGLQARMSQTARRYIRAGQRAGVAVVEEVSPEAQEAFYDLFTITSKRDGFFLRPRRYMRRYWQQVIDAGYGRFLFARKDGENLAAMFLTSFNGKIWYKDGVSEETGQRVHATYVLQWAAMQWGKRHGATYYDMVAIPDPGQLENREHEMWGLYDFKRKFGGEVREFVRAYQQPYLRRTAAVWRRLEPLYYRVYMKLKRDVYY